MSAGITMKHLEYRMGKLNSVLGRPDRVWTEAPPNREMNVGHFFLEKGMGGWQLCEITTTGGGQNCPFGYRRHSKADMCELLDAILKGIELARK